MYPGQQYVRPSLEEPPHKMHGWERLTPQTRALMARVWEAERHARRVLPPKMAAIVVDELQSWRDFAWRFDDGVRIRKLTDEVLAMRPKPKKPAAKPAPVIASNVA